MSDFYFTSEAAFEGHADKVCDLIADTLLDAYISQDPRARVGIEALFKGDLLVVAGEVTSTAEVDVLASVRRVLSEVGYLAPRPHNVDTIQTLVKITEQSPEIRAAIARATDAPKRGGASDQGIMFGYATCETPELMPLPIQLAHSIARNVSVARRGGVPGWILPDGKAAVTVHYDSRGNPLEVAGVLVAIQHDEGASWSTIDEWCRSELLPKALGDWMSPRIQVRVNPLGYFRLGGPEIDCGVTGRKIIPDTYGGAGRIGGGSLSGKDPSKLDRTGAYFTRYVAREVVQNGLAKRAEVQVAYGFALSKPLSVRVETFGTGDSVACAAFVETFDFTPDSVIRFLRLERPIYRETALFGHFGRSDFPWEQSHHRVPATSRPRNEH